MRFLPLLLLFVLCACGSSDSPSKSASATQPDEQGDNEQISVETPSQPPPDDTYQNLIHRLWQTALGREYYSFLKNPMVDAEITRRAEAITRRLFQEERASITRISILQILSENLHERGELDETAARRLLILEGRVSLYRIQISRMPSEKIIAHGSAILGGSILYELARAKGLADYSLRRAAMFFLNAFGAYSIVFFLWHDLHEAPSGQAIDQKLLVADFDRIVQEAESF